MRYVWSELTGRVAIDFAQKQNKNKNLIKDMRQVHLKVFALCGQPVITLLFVLIFQSFQQMMKILKQEIPPHTDIFKEDERFNYTDNEPIDCSMLGTAGSPRHIRPWNFMDVINPKKQALAIAREIDAQRGVRLELVENQGNSTPDTPEETSSQSTVRRLPSGARPPSNGHTIRATTPVKTTATTATHSGEQTIKDVAGQSTPLTMARIYNQEVIEKKPVENLESSEDHTTDYVAPDFKKETALLRDEISKLKEQISKHEDARLEKDANIKILSENLDERVSQISSLKELVQSKETNLSSLEKEIDDFKSLLDFSEKNRLLDNENKMNEINDLKKDLDTHIEMVKEIELMAKNNADKFEKDKEALERTIDDLKKTINQEREAEREKQRTLQEAWQRKVDEQQRGFLQEKKTLEVEHSRKVHQIEDILDEKTTNLEVFQDKCKQKADEVVSKTQDLENMKKLRIEVINEKNALALSMKNAEDRISKLQVDISEAEKKSLEIMQRNADVQKKLKEEHCEHDKTRQKFEAMEAHTSSLTKFVENLELFDIKLGSIVLNTFKKDSVIPCLDPFFSIKHKDIIGFYTKEQNRKYQELEKKCEKFRLKNLELTTEIEGEWKSKVEKQSQKSLQQKEALEQLQSKFESAEEKLEKSLRKLEEAQDEKAHLLKEKEAILQGNVTLIEEVNALKNSRLTKEQERFMELVNKIEDLTQSCTKMREQIELEMEQNEVLKTSIEDKSKQLNELQDTCNHQAMRLQETEAKLKKIQGDDSRRITFEIARRSRPDIDRATYENLMVNKVDAIDMVELQNIVKNLILLLEIPFNRLTNKSPLVAIYLKYERPIFSHFANRLHYEVFNELIDMKRFTNEAYNQYAKDHNMMEIQHPLESCLENLYQKVVSKI